VAERISGRRWTLHLEGGLSVDLPPTSEAEALARLTRLLESGLGGARRIDLRVPTRAFVGGFEAGTAERAPVPSTGRS
jgi:cell division septal protein FtsQ